MPDATSRARRLTVVDDAFQPAADPKKRRRPRGEGSVYETGDGRIRAAIVVVDPETGRRRRIVRSGSTKSEARRNLGDALREFRAGTGSGQTLDDYLLRWLPGLVGRVRPSTWRFHEQHARKHLRPSLGSLALSAITPGHVERLTSRMIAGGLSPTTARGVRVTLGRILRDALRDGLVDRNVAALSRPPRAVRHEITVLSAGETRRLIEGAADDELGPAIAVAAVTGLRLGELLGLSWDDVDVDSSTPTLTVRRSMAKGDGNAWALAEPKTARSRRTLELAPVAVAALQVARIRQDASRSAAAELWQDRDRLVFTDELGRPWKPWTVTRAFVATLDRLGLPRVRFHDLRHGVASMLLAQGVPLKLVSDALGHSTIGITADTYAHLDREQRRAAAAAIERAIGGDPG